MASKKYINTMEVVELTGRPYDEILNLVKTGALPAHKSRRGRWRLNVDVVEQYFNVLINHPKEDNKQVVTKLPKVPKPVDDGKNNSKTRLITNENHYQDVIQRICAAKSSIKIINKVKPQPHAKLNCATPQKYFLAKNVIFFPYALFYHKIDKKQKSI